MLIYGLMDRKATDFEKPILELEEKLKELLRYPPSMQRDARVEQLQAKIDATRREIFSHLSRWQVTLVARHPERPYTLDYLEALFSDLLEVHGDRLFGDDPAMVSGFARFHGQPVCVVGHQKGRGTKEKLHRNFGMPHPEGYRKALRVMRLAEKFDRPVFSFVDTPGAYPGAGAEERGVAAAIATNLRELIGLRVPVLITVIGEGGSGGALAIAIGDRVNMLEFSIYSVISPESCSSILWRDTNHPEEAAEALRLTAPDLLELGLIDEIVPEPLGGAHVDRQQMFRDLDSVLYRQLTELSALDVAELIDRRYQKFRSMGSFSVAGESR